MSQQSIAPRAEDGVGASPPVSLTATTSTTSTSASPSASQVPTEASPGPRVTKGPKTKQLKTGNVAPRQTASTSTGSASPAPSQASSARTPSKNHHQRQWLQQHASEIPLNDASEAVIVHLAEYLQTNGHLLNPVELRACRLKDIRSLKHDIEEKELATFPKRVHHLGLAALKQLLQQGVTMERMADESEPVESLQDKLNIIVSNETVEELFVLWQSAVKDSTRGTPPRVVAEFAGSSVSLVDLNSLLPGANISENLVRFYLRYGPPTPVLYLISLLMNPSLFVDIWKMRIVRLIA